MMTVLPLGVMGEFNNAWRRVGERCAVRLVMQLCI